MGVDLQNGDGFQFYTTIAYLTGATTSIFSGYVGMKIATYANYRTAYLAYTFILIYL